MWIASVLPRSVAHGIVGARRPPIRLRVGRLEGWKVGGLEGWRVPPRLPARVINLSCSMRLRLTDPKVRTVRDLGLGIG